MLKNSSLLLTFVSTGAKEGRSANYTRIEVLKYE